MRTMLEIHDPHGAPLERRRWRNPYAIDMTLRWSGKLNRCTGAPITFHVLRFTSPHVAPLVLKKYYVMRKMSKRFFLSITHCVLFIVFSLDLR